MHHFHRQNPAAHGHLRCGVVFVFAAITSSLCAVADEPQAIRAFLENHCYDCHDSASKKQGLDVESLKFTLDDPAATERWIKMYDRVKAGEMPPAKSEQPKPAEREAFTKALHDVLIAHDRQKHRTHGRTVLRRLNRIEWENSVHDLLQVAVPLAFMLPEDTPLHGFDTVAEGLRLSPLHIEKYLEAADAAIDAAIDLREAPKMIKQRFSLKEERDIRNNLDTPQGKITDPNSNGKHRQLFRELDDAIVIFNEGYSPADMRAFNPSMAGQYRIKVSAYGYKSGGRHVTLRVYASNWHVTRLLGYFDMPPEKPRVAEFTTFLAHNEHLIIKPYDTGFDDKGKTLWQVDAAEFEGAGLAVQWYEVEGPLLESWPPPSVKAMFGDVPVRELPKNRQTWKHGRRVAYELVPEKPREAVKPVVERFAARAFRRPIESGEAEGYIALATGALDEGVDFEGALRIAFRAILTSPQFLLLDERPGVLSDHALASRLSYFFWSSLPDEELLKLANEKKLSQPAVLREQVERMLKSSRAAAFTKNFVGQWLDLRSIDATSPDARLYPEFDELLQHAMIGESEAFFNELLTHDLSVTNFIDSDFVMANHRLAAHYGLESVTGEKFQRVKLPDSSPRGGVLTQASVLKVTANGTVTSPVMRGTWVMKRLLGDPPSPPPPNLGSVEPDTRGTTTIRDQLDKHRNVESCASCHRKIDPPGFALESFDVIGGYRERYRSKDKGDQPNVIFKGRRIHEYRLALPVDASGVMPDGRPFDDVRAFKKLLMTQKEAIARNVAKNLLVYSTGAGTTFADRAALDAIVREAAKKDYGLRSMVHAVVASDVFRSK